MPAVTLIPLRRDVNIWSCRHLLVWTRTWYYLSKSSGKGSQVGDNPCRFGKTLCLIFRLSVYLVGLAHLGTVRVGCLPHYQPVPRVTDSPQLEQSNQRRATV